MKVLRKFFPLSKKKAYQSTPFKKCRKGGETFPCNCFQSPTIKAILTFCTPTPLLEFISNSRLT